jgi:hypothetical protein
VTIGRNHNLAATYDERKAFHIAVHPVRLGRHRIRCSQNFRFFIAALEAFLAAIAFNRRASLAVK